MNFCINGSAETWHRDETGEIGEFPGTDERQQYRREWREGCGRRTAEKKQQIPSEEKGFLQILGRGGALRNYV